MSFVNMAKIGIGCIVVTYVVAVAIIVKSAKKSEKQFEQYFTRAKTTDEEDQK